MEGDTETPGQPEEDSQQWGAEAEAGRARHPRPQAALPASPILSLLGCLPPRYGGTRKAGKVENMVLLKASREKLSGK